MLPEIPSLAQEVENRYKEIEEAYPDWTENKIMMRLQEVFDDSIFMVWWNEIYIKRWRGEK